MIGVYFQTHGCATNISESEIMMGLLNKAGFRIVSKPEEADILIISVCTVKGEEKAIRETRKLNERFPDKKLIVAGCITKTVMREARKIKENISFISTHNITMIVDVVEEVINGNIISLVAYDRAKKINLPKIRKNPIIGIIPILSGCANNCSYCSVKLIKGNLVSYSPEDIEKELLECLAEGCKEIWITSQDNAAYMLEQQEKSKLPELIKDILKINKKFFIRIGMMNPSNLLPILDEMIEVYKNKKVFKFLHIPVQSGNDKILELMERKYSVGDFKKIINKFRSNIPNITISTDIIVGFPTETDEQFNDSLNLIKEIKPDVLNISRFQPRLGTRAEKIKGKIKGEIIKKRSRLLTEIFTNISRMQNERWISWEGEILVDEKGKDSSWIGRNFAYKPVIVKENLKLGDVVRVRIESITPYDLRGTII